MEEDKDFAIVSGYTISECDFNVNEYLQRGYVLRGDLFVYDGQLCQAMVNYGRPTDVDAPPLNG